MNHRAVLVRCDLLIRCAVSLGGASRLSCMGVVIVLVTMFCDSPIAADEIDVARLEREEPVDFDREILPLFRRSCLACHNETVAESDLVLESVESIREGGATGGVLVPGKPEESFLLQVSAHQAEPVMPPENNSVEAPNLTSQELGLLQLWIAQGAQASTAAASALAFEPLPPGLNPIYAIALSDDGQHLAVGRANQVSVYHVPTQTELARLTDPKLIEDGLYANPGVAHLDLVQSIAVTDGGQTIATGGYRTVKLWRRQPASSSQFAADVAVSAVALERTSGKAWVGTQTGKLMSYPAGGQAPLTNQQAHRGELTAMAMLPNGIVTAGEDRRLHFWRMPASQEDAAKQAELQLQRWVQFPAAVVSIVPSPRGDAVVVLDEQGKLAVWSTSGGRQPVPETLRPPRPPQPLTQWSLPEQAPHRLIFLAPAAAQDNSTETGSDAWHIATADRQGVITVWEIAASRKQPPQSLKTFQHGAEVHDLAWDARHRRVLSCGSDGTLKAWSLADGKLAYEQRGDFRAELDVRKATYQVQVAARRVNLAQQDLEQAKQRQMAEAKEREAAATAVTQAETSRAEKQAAVEAAQAAQQQAQQELKQLQQQLATAQQQLAELPEAIKQLESRSAAMQQQQQLAEKGVAQAQQRQQQLLQTFDKLRQAIAKSGASPPEELQQFADTARQIAEASEQLQQQWQAQQLAVAGRQAAQQKQQELTQQQQSAQQELQRLQAAVPAAEKKVADAKPGVQQAEAQRAAAVRAVEDAQAALARAQRGEQRAGEAVPAAEQALAAEQRQQQDLQAVQQRAQERFKQAVQPLVSLWVDAAAGQLHSLTRDGRWQTWQASDGVPLQAESLPSGTYLQGESAAAGPQLVRTTAGLQWLSRAGDWTLAHRWGEADGESPFVDRVTALAFRPGGRQLAAGSGEPSRSGQIILLDPEQGEVLAEIDEPHSDAVWSLAYSPDGKRLASAAADRFLKVFDVEQRKLIRGFEGHTHHVLGVAWSADGRRLATSSGDKSLKIWNAATGEQLFTIGGLKKEATGIRFVGLENHVAASTGEQAVVVRRADNGGFVRNLTGFSDFVHCVETTPDGHLIAAGGQDSVVRVWTQDGKLVAEFPAR